MTGGAGYIGSHVVLTFRESGHVVVVLDNLSTGSRGVLPVDVAFYEGDVGSSEATGQLIKRHGVDAVMHFSGTIVIPESVRNPLEYYRNNACTSRSLIENCVRKGVRHFVFSSAAAVYGAPAAVPVTEDMPTVSINPYGASKLLLMIAQRA